MNKVLTLTLLATLLSACGKKVKDTKRSDGPEPNEEITLEDQVLKQELEAAISSGDTNILISTLKNHEDLDFKFKSGHTPLTLAIHKRRTEIITLILQKVKKIDLKDDFGNTPLSKAVKFNNLFLTELLIKREADINLLDDQGLNPLYTALLESFEKVALVLIKNGASIEYRAPNQKSVPELAYDLQLKEVADLIELIQAHTTPSNLQLIRAVREANSDFVEFLLNNFPDYQAIIAARNILSTALHISHKEKRLKMLKTLINKGANPNHPEGVLPLIQATESEQVDSVDLLLLYANPFLKDFYGLTALSHAAAVLNKQLVLKILRRMQARSLEENIIMDDIVSAACLAIPSRRRQRSTPNGVINALQIKNLLDCD